MSDCRCPGSPHTGSRRLDTDDGEGPVDGDWAFLKPFLLYAEGAEAMRMIRKAEADPELFTELVGPVYLKHGVVSWNKVDEAGEPVPVTPDAIAALRYEDAFELGDRADDLYGESVLAPLVRRIEALSRTGQTAASTSPNSPSRSTRRKRSARSSRRRSEASTPSTD